MRCEILKHLRKTAKRVSNANEAHRLVTQQYPDAWMEGSTAHFTWVPSRSGNVRFLDQPAIAEAWAVGRNGEWMLIIIPNSGGNTTEGQLR